MSLFIFAKLILSYRKTTTNPPYCCWQQGAHRNKQGARLPKGSGLLFACLRTEDALCTSAPALGSVGLGVVVDVSDLHDLAVGTVGLG